MRICYDKEVDISTAQLERALKSVCSFLNHKVGVTGREMMYILTRHEPDINPPFPQQI